VMSCRCYSYVCSNSWHLVVVVVIVIVVVVVSCVLMLLQLYLLKKYLRMSSSNDKLLSANLLGSGISRAFLKAMVCILGKFGSHRYVLCTKCVIKATEIN